MRKPHDIAVAMSLPDAEHTFLSIADPLGRIERALRVWEPVKVILCNGQRVIIRRKEELA